MTALAADRLTKARRPGNWSYGQKGATTIYAGSLVCLDANGLAVPGATATTLIAVGRAIRRSANAGADSAVRVDVEPGVFQFANSAAGDLIGITEIGKDVYIVDDQTVAKTSGTNTRSIAGKVKDVDANGVWVLVGIR